MKAKVVLIEFQDNRPFAAVEIDSRGNTRYYDIEWCKRDQQLYAHYSGNRLYLESQDNKFWAAVGYEPDNYKPENRLANKPKKYRGELENWTLFDDCLYCSICDDWLPEEDTCDHIWWDEELGDFSTPYDRKEATQ